MLNHIEQIAIVGTGLLGGSLGLAIKKAGYTGRVLGVGRREQILQTAAQRGCIDQSTTDPAAAARTSGLVVLATPLSTFPPLLEQIAAGDHDNLLITDVGSTKHQVCDQAHRTLPDPTRFLGSHPMAGGEQHGPEHARADLFQNKPCVVTPQPNTGALVTEAVEHMWRAIGMRLLRMEPAEHDRAVATASHCPHIAAALLVELAAKTDSLRVAATGFKDVTRVASGDPALWRDILATNREHTADAIDRFINRLTEIREQLKQQNDDATLNALQNSKDLRDQWLASWVSNADEG